MGGGKNPSKEKKLMELILSFIMRQDGDVNHFHAWPRSEPVPKVGQQFEVDLSSQQQISKTSYLTKPQNSQDRTR